MKALFGFLSGILGTAVWFVMMFLFLFSLPLNVLVFMRWWGWEWWGALIAAIFLNFIPIAGQIAYAVFTVVGAYYFISSGWDWRAAVNPELPTVSLAQMSPASFNDYKNSKLRLVFERGCQDDALKQYGTAEGKLPTLAASYCECFARAVVSEITQAGLHPVWMTPA